MLKFMNKLISGDVNEPLPVEAIVNGTSVVDPAYLKNKFLEAEVVGNMGWKYNRMIENLKKVSTV